MTETERAHLAADDYFENQRAETDLQKILADLGDARSAFYERLAARVSTAPSHDGEEDDGIAASPQVLDEAWNLYVAATGQRAAAPADLGDPATWMRKEEAFGGDPKLLLKLANALVSAPSRKFVRYAADVLGTNLKTVSEHFAGGGRNYMATVERKASGRQRDEAAEDFASAVRNARIPEQLKARWL